MERVALLIPGVEYSVERPFLLVGSRADPSWAPFPAEHVYEAADADHDMEVKSDPVRSAGILTDVTAAMDAFARGLQ